jgi:putative tryptophan/tyrosine transport system substrate-binding protein
MRRRDFLGVMSGATAALPVMARAQSTKMPVIGVLSVTALTGAQISGLHDGLVETGYVEGRDVTILVHSADGDFDRLPALAADLIGRQVAVIVAINSPVPARAAKAATKTIPIVFAYGGDPIADNLVSSLNRPEGNVTGTTFINATLSSKRLELLNEIVPGLTDIALLVNPKGTLAESQIRDTQKAMQKTGQRLHVLNASSASEVDSAFAEIGSSNAKALLVGTDPTLGSLFRDQIIALAARYKIPTMYGSRAAGRAGGLISYGADSGLTWRQAGVYAGRVLKGEKPADLPIIQPTKFELVVNLRAAKALGLTMSESFLIRADEVIE